jgi:hypothetical protein
MAYNTYAHHIDIIISDDSADIAIKQEVKK